VTVLEETPSGYVSAPESAPEVGISRDLAKRGLYAAPVVVAIGAVFGGVNGAFSALFALGLVVVNFLLSAALISYTARVSLTLMMGAILGGYILRLGLITLAVLAVKDLSWVSLTALGITIIVTHLGLLFWELKYLAIALAFPGVRPDVPNSDHPRRNPRPKEL